MLPNSVSLCVLMYFLSGNTSRYAPMLTSCLSPSVSTSPVFTPLAYSPVPSTQNSPSFSDAPCGLVSSPAVLRLGLVSSAGYAPLHRFSISISHSAPLPLLRSRPPNRSTDSLCCAAAFSFGKYISSAPSQHRRSAAAPPCGVPVRAR